MANTILILILWYANVIHKSGTNLLSSWIVSLFTKTDKMLFVGFPYSLNKTSYTIKWKLLCGLVHIPLYYLSYSLASFKWFMVYTIIFLLIRCIRHVKMQLNDVIKSIGWYRAFVPLPTQPNIALIPILAYTYQHQCITIKNIVLEPGHLYQNFDPVNIRRPWTPEIINL